MMVVATGASTNGLQQQQHHQQHIEQQQQQQQQQQQLLAQHQQQQQQHQQQQQQQQQHQQPQLQHRQIITSTLAQHQQQLQNNNTTIIATTQAPAANGNASGVGVGSTAIVHATATTTPSNLEAFSNIATAAAQTLELSSLNAAQLVGGHLTADGNFVTMGGVVVGRLHPAPGAVGNTHFLQHQLRIQTPHLGVIKMEPSPNATEYISNNNNNNNNNGNSNNNNNNNNSTTHTNNTNEG